ncbi:hypothetical protein M409DRAFT_27728 [Zasmidium cellare ATCC 36951]|uniref:Uncharacterized protein n=1 Tax=Zasmidium cellare ATCC 36951 TaxID=1080233 RepID=A0A6A6C501_ZASCE|nr:uncharacterized protein M409DRAFT_27728 [Zasmidium cellare ATCC 36951]KAF2162003.1 hypothetical protein M409DRAFT_27728 [Zasmidium cellare ATCC 36951]
MPCDSNVHSHTWAPPGSVMVGFFTPDECESICAYCPLPPDGGERMKFEGLRDHVLAEHFPSDADAMSEIAEHKALRTALRNYKKPQQAVSPVADQRLARIRLKVYHEALFVRVDRRVALQALATRHLREAIKSHSTSFARGSSTHNAFIDSITASFTTTHAPEIWSNSKHHRGHLAKAIPLYDDKWTMSSNMRLDILGPVCTIDNSMPASRKREWNKRNSGTTLTDEVNFQNSSFGIVMRHYFAALYDLVVGGGDEEGEGEEQELGSGKSEEELRWEVVKGD